MTKPLMDTTAVKWFSGGALLGAILGICFFVLFSPEVPKSAEEGGGTTGYDKAFAEGLVRSERLAAEGKTAEAMAALKVLIDRFPTHPEAYNNLAALHASQGELETSRELLEKALLTHDGYATAYENLGIIYAEIARSSYGKALRLDLAPSAPRLRVVTPGAAPPSPATAVAPKSSSAAATPASALFRRSPVVEEPAPSKPSAQPTPEEASAAATPAQAPPAPESEPAPPSWEEDVLLVLRAWADAWSKRDVPGYLAFYSTHFQPEGGLDRTAWEELRRQRILHPSWIKVTLSDIVLTPTGPDSIQVKLVQSYDADTYKDRIRKTLNLVREGDSWRILTENTLGLAR